MVELNEILDCLKSVNVKVRIGVAGSYARGTANNRSDIDVVVDTDILDIVDIENIKNKIRSKFGKSSDVICLKLLEQEDKELDELAISIGVGVNDSSAYKMIMREVVWCE